MMRLFKSKAFRHAEHALKAARTMDEVDVVRNAARAAMKPGEFGHFLKKIAARRQQLADDVLKWEEVTRY